MRFVDILSALFIPYALSKLAISLSLKSDEPSMRQKFVFTPFYQMLYPKDRQNRLPLFYRNNIQKRGGIVPHIVPIELQKHLFCAAVGKEKSQNIFRLRRKISDKIMQQIPRVALTFDMTSGIIILI